MIVRDVNGKVVDRLKYTGGRYVNFQDKIFNSRMLGKTKPLDVYQSCLADSLATNNMTMVKGRAGSGKSLLSLSYAMDCIESQK